MAEPEERQALGQTGPVRRIVKILLLADIHGNLPALQAVLGTSAAAGCAEAWCLGDIVGYGPFPNECAKLVAQRMSRVISGNHDAKVVSAKKVARFAVAHKEAYKGFIFTWTHHALSPETVKYLKSLPGEERCTTGTRRVVLLHGSPEGVDDGLSVHTPEARLAALAARAKADVILVGHTHDAFFRRSGKSFFINPGSVGRPFDGDPRASFAVLDISARGVRAKMHRIAYDHSGVIDEMERQDFPDVLVRAFATSRSPADVLPVTAQGSLVEEAQKFGARARYERPHALQVARLALELFDGLGPLHGYAPGGRERALLQAGALLHDIGLLHGEDGHHKASRDMILEDRLMPLSDRERVVVALVARYHRRALPTDEHKLFAALPDHHKMMVERLGAFTRLADALDRSHRGLIKGLEAVVGRNAVTVKLSAQEPINAELECGKVKGDLFERAFGKKLYFVQG